MTQPLLKVRDLTVGFDTIDGELIAVDRVSFDVPAGETLGVVGESGSGKSVMSLTLMGLTRFDGARISGSVEFAGRELLTLSETELRELRGSEIAMIFQDPMSSLHPLYSIGWQLEEAINAHRDLDAKQARMRARELLDWVGIAEAGRRLDDYPHQLSGGMLQRVMIAMALINEPRLLIADEPTTALDVTIQAQILELIERLGRELRMTTVLVTHDLGVIAQTADRVAVMYAGQIVELADVDELFTVPQHPYTWGLLRSLPEFAVERGMELVPIAGRPPSMLRPPEGCRFHPRCPFAVVGHDERVPELMPVDGAPGHYAACLLEAATRRQLWPRLRAGSSSLQARRDLTLGDAPSGSAAAVALAGQDPALSVDVQDPE